MSLATHLGRDRIEIETPPSLRLPPQNVQSVLGQPSAEHPDFARNSVGQLLLDMGQWMTFCSLD